MLFLHRHLSFINYPAFFLLLVLTSVSLAECLSYSPMSLACLVILRILVFVPSRAADHYSLWSKRRPCKRKYNIHRLFKTSAVSYHPVLSSSPIIQSYHPVLLSAILLAFRTVLPVHPCMYHLRIHWPCPFYNHLHLIIHNSHLHLIPPRLSRLSANLRLSQIKIAEPFHCRLSSHLLIYSCQLEAALPAVLMAAYIIHRRRIAPCHTDTRPVFPWQYHLFYAHLE